MSNHEISYAFGELIDKVLELHDKKELSDKAARTILSLSLDIVCGEDGNAGEATEEMDQTHCSGCLNPFAEGENFVSYYEADDIVREDEQFKNGWGRWWYDEAQKHELIGSSLCESCFRKIFQKKLGDELTERVITNSKKD